MDTTRTAPPPPPHDAPGWATRQPTPRTSRLPSAAEALGWGGGITTVVGVIAVTWDFWSALGGWALVALLATASAVLAVAATVVGGLDRQGDDRLAGALATGLWWMTGVATSVTTYVAADEVAGGRPFLALLAAALASTTMCAAAAHRTMRDSALAGTVASAAVTTFAAASLAGVPDVQRAAVVWATGLVALLAITALRPTASRGAFALSATLLFGAGQAVLALDPGVALVVALLIGTTTAAGAALAYRRRGEAVATGLAAAGIAIQVLYDLAPEVFSLSTSVLIAGIAMVVACTWLVRRASRDGS